MCFFFGLIEISAAEFNEILRGKPFRQTNKKKRKPGITGLLYESVYIIRVVRLFTILLPLSWLWNNITSIMVMALSAMLIVSNEGGL